MLVASFTRKWNSSAIASMCLRSSNWTGRAFLTDQMHVLSVRVQESPTDLTFLTHFSREAMLQPPPPPASSLMTLSDAKMTTGSVSVLVMILHCTTHQPRPSSATAVYPHMSIDPTSTHHAIFHERRICSVVCGPRSPWTINRTSM